MPKYMPRKGVMESSKPEISKTKDGVGLSYLMLARSNYTVWAIKMRVFMQAHGVWDAIDPKDSNSKVDERKDKTALAAIYQGIHEDILMSIAVKTRLKRHGEP